MLIFLIAGESGSGKSTIVNRLPYHKIKSYTTRPKRNKYDTDHTFIGRSEVSDYYNIVAITYINNEFYFATEAQFSDINLYIVDDKGIQDVIQYYGAQADIYTILITRENIDVELKRKNRKISRFYNDWDFILHNDGNIESSVKKLNEWIEKCIKVYQQKK